MKFSLIYNFKKENDELIVLFSDKKITNKVTAKNLEVCYHEKEIVKYKIYNISKIMRIKAEGLIVLPPNALIDAINSILIQHNLDKLNYVTDSLFVIGEIKEIMLKENEKFLYVVNLGQEENSFVYSKFSNIPVKSKIVIAKNGARLFDNSRIADVLFIKGTKCAGMICSTKDLNIDENDEPLILDDDSIIGADFFTSEVK